MASKSYLGALLSMLGGPAHERGGVVGSFDIENTPPPAPPQAVDTTCWNLPLLQILDHRRFEHACASYFRELGFRVLIVSRDPDSQVDLEIYTPGAPQPGMLAQCKATRGRPVEIEAARDLYAAMVKGKVAEGIIAATGTFRPDAAAFAAEHGIHLIDGPDFLAKLEALTPEFADALLQEMRRTDFPVSNAGRG